ncbi:MAG TPA: phosphotransferase family protein [Stellaceae bacterium]|jgi:aminoglycoside phosphotransferase (APT) family kinase protein|nr:phosphotransferase family protein [Stellaceae bacterium]
MQSLLEAAELIAERADERLDTARLEPYLRAHLPGAEGRLSVAQFHGGKANLTYLLRFGEREFVLRRPPLGPIPPGAHDMRREHRVLSVLHRRFPLAPQSLLLCEDETVIGAVFIVEERRHGFVIRDDIPAEFADRPELNRRIGFALVDALADLHRVDPAEIGLDGLGRVEGFLERQLSGWIRRWEASLGGREEAQSRAEIVPVLDWLTRRRPAERAGALLHNDYRLDNCLLDTGDPARIVAVLDWDMCTRGDPLADLGYVLNYWVEPGDDPEWREIASMPTWRDGFPSRAEVIRRYGERTGSDVGEILWYQVFAAFKLAVIIQQIYIRYVRGQTRDARFANYWRRVLGLARKGRILISS